jgi:chromosome segregation ATPase
MTTDADLRTRERNLERDTEEMRQKKVDADRVLSKTQAEIDVLAPRATALRKTVDSLKAEIAQLALNRSADQSVDDNLQASISREREQVTALSERRQQVESSLSDKRKEISEKLAEYEAIYEKKIADAINTRLEERQTVENELEKARQELEIIHNDILNAAELRRVSELELETFKQKSEAEIAKISDNMDTRRRELSHLSDQTAGLTAMRTELEEWNSALEADHNRFILYERTATAVLKNTDNALQARESAVEQKEQYKPISRSFLPPRTE